MTRILSIHSFRGGTGKSNVTANLATLLAKKSRVAVIDTDIQSPGVHVLFGISRQSGKTLNHYLWGECPIEAAVQDVSAAAGDIDGALYLVPSSIDGGDIGRMLREGYDVSLLTEAIEKLPDLFQLDYLLIDTHPGVNEETLLSVAVSDVLVLMMRPDKQDFQGTAVTVELASRLGVPKLLIGLNKVPPSMDTHALRQHVEATFGAVAGCVLPLNFEMAELGSGGLFVLQKPQHPWSRELSLLAKLVAE